MSKSKLSSEEFLDELKKIRNETEEKIHNLIFKVREGNQDVCCEYEENDQNPLSSNFSDNPEIERVADSFVELGGWIIDRLNGRTRMDKKITGQKIKKNSWI